jgi:hypothetical protein
MPRKKAARRQDARPERPFKGELAKPILTPFSYPQLNADEKPVVSVSAGTVARLEKLPLLAEHYGVTQGDWFNLALRLAIDFVPGFRVLYDDPLARALKLPDAFYGLGNKPKGSGRLPEWVNGNALIVIFEAFRNRFPAESDTSLSQRIVAALIPELAGSAHKSERERVAKTLRNRMMAARSSLPIS